MCKCIVCVHINSLSLSLALAAVRNQDNASAASVYLTLELCLLSIAVQNSPLHAFSLNRSFYLQQQMRISLSFVMAFVFISGVCQGKHHYFFFILICWPFEKSFILSITFLCRTPWQHTGGNHSEHCSNYKYTCKITLNTLSTTYQCPEVFSFQVSH